MTAAPLIDRSIVLPPPAELGENCEIADKRKNRRRFKARLRATAAKLLPEHAIRGCGRKIGGRRDAEMEGWVKISRGERSAHYVGPVSCGNIWVCRICAEKIAEKRRQEVAEGLKNHQEAGGVAWMATFTIPHHAFNQVADVRGLVMKAYGKLKAGKPWQKARDRAGLIGDIRAQEITHGENGWHPHIHTLFLLDHDSPAEAEAFGEWLFERWARIVTAAGWEAPSRQAFTFKKAGTIAEAGDYVAKWGAPSELTASHEKRAKGGGRSVWDILADIADYDLPHDRWLFRQYAEAFKGARQLQWSRGLKKLLLEMAEDQTDEEIANTPEPESKTLGYISLYGWNMMCGKGLTVAALEIIETAATWEDFVLSMGALGVPMACFKPPGDQSPWANLPTLI